jgi:hypothetical protein
MLASTHVILTNTCNSHQHMLFSPTHVILINTYVILRIARVGEYNICVGEYNIYQCVICVFEHSIHVGQNGICIREYIIAYVFLLTLCNIVHDNDFCMLKQKCTLLTSQ